MRTTRCKNHIGSPVFIVDGIICDTSIFISMHQNFLASLTRDCPTLTSFVFQILKVSTAIPSLQPLLLLLSLTTTIGFLFSRAYTLVNLLRKRLDESGWLGGAIAHLRERVLVSGPAERRGLLVIIAATALLWRGDQDFVISWLGRLALLVQVERQTCLIVGVSALGVFLDHEWSHGDVKLRGLMLLRRFYCSCI